MVCKPLLDSMQTGQVRCQPCKHVAATGDGDTATWLTKVRSSSWPPKAVEAGIWMQQLTARTTDTLTSSPFGAHLTLMTFPLWPLR